MHGIKQASDPLCVESRAHRVKYVREQIVNLSRAEFCEGSSISPHALKAWEMAIGGGLTEKGACKLVELLKDFRINCSVPWLLYGIGLEPNRGPRKFDISLQQEVQIADELLTFLRQGNSLYGIVQEDTMMPQLPPGTYVAGLRISKIADAIGQDCVIKTSDDFMYIRKLLPGKSEHFWNLAATNAHCVMAKPLIENVTIQAVAPIIWIRKLDGNR